MIKAITLLVIGLGLVVVGLFHPTTTDAQMARVAQDVCLARWEWITGEDGGPYWNAPFASDRIGTLDLRSIPEHAPGPVAQGWAFFSYDTPMGATGMACYGGNLDRGMTTAQANTIAIVLGLDSGDIRARNMRDILVELLIHEADPTGVDRWKPVQLTRRGLTIQLAGFGQIYGERFSETGASMQNTLDIRWADYRRHKAAGVETDVLRRWTGHEAESLFGREPTSRDLERLIPTEHRGDGYLAPATTFGDTFNRADNVDLNDVDTGKTKDGGAGTWQWVEDTGNADIDTNQVVKDSGDKTYIRANDSLSSDDHYSEIDIITNPSGSDRQSVMARMDSGGATTFYRGNLRGTNDEVQLIQIISGSESQLGSNAAVTVSVPDKITVTADGSTIEVSWNDVVQISETDTGITGNLQAGFGFGDSDPEAAELDNWFASDIAAAAARRVVNVN